MSSTRWARIGFGLVAWLFAATVIFQFYLAGQAVFGTSLYVDLHRNFELHRNVGYLIGVLALILLVLSFAGRMPRRVIGGSALLLGLMILQSVLVMMRDGSPNIAALHPLNGMLIVLVALWQAWRSLGHARAPLPPERLSPAAPAAAVAPEAPPEKADDET